MSEEWMNRSVQQSGSGMTELKLVNGVYVLEVVGEPTTAEGYKDKDGKKIGKDKLVIPVKCQERFYEWKVPITNRSFKKRGDKTIVSRFSQLLEIGKKRGGLNGVVLKVTVSGEKLDTEYVIEAK